MLVWKDEEFEDLRGAPRPKLFQPLTSIPFPLRPVTSSKSKNQLFLFPQQVWLPFFTACPTLSLCLARGRYHYTPRQSPLSLFRPSMSWFPNDIPAASVLSTIPQSLEQQWNDRLLSGLFFDTVRLGREQYKVSEVHVRVMTYFAIVMTSQWVSLLKESTALFTLMRAWVRARALVRLGVCA